MTKSLTIKGFKNIRDKITIQEFSSINYLVGKNGSGKSSVLNAIALLNDERLAQPLIKQDGLVLLMVDGKRCYIESNPSLQNGEVKKNGELFIKCYTQKYNEFRELNADVTQLDFDFSLENCKPEEKDKHFDLLNRVLNSLGMSNVNLVDEGNKWAPRISFLQDNIKIELPLLSQGVKSLNNLEYILKVIENDLQNDWYLKNYKSFFILLEEPENNLHPDFQKKIPIILNKFLNNLDDNLNNRVHFFISTHSPFIIGLASDFVNQKVYLLEDGLLNNIVILNDVPHLEAVNISEGYNGTECAWIVGKMLGADITDLGYPENYCILEEYSMQVILEHAREFNLIKNIQFVSASGESNVIKLKERMDNVEKLNTLIKCNPYYYGKYLIIIDSTQNFEVSKKRKFENIRTKIGDRFIELSENGIEEYYKNINTKIYKESIKAISKEDDPYEKGKLKEKYALEILPFINSKKDFTALFNAELDILLK